MPSDEAVSTVEPRSITAGNKTLRRAGVRYYIAICLLFAAVVILCVHNLSIYKSYMNDKKIYSNIFEKLDAITESKNITDSVNEALSRENAELKALYEEISARNKEISIQINEIRRQNDELMKKNRELSEDNVELQNTLKKAAAVGIKPQNFTSFEGISSRGSIDRGSYVGNFHGTFYTPSKDECGNDKGITNSGKPIVPGISVAVDNKYWPFGTIFYIKGLGYAVAMDTGSAIKGKYRFDFAVFDKKFAYKLGSQKWEVYLVKLGNGKVEDLKF